MWAWNYEKGVVIENGNFEMSANERPWMDGTWLVGFVGSRPQCHHCWL